MERNSKESPHIQLEDVKNASPSPERNIDTPLTPEETKLLKRATFVSTHAAFQLVLMRD
jgi:hypothetical protein